MKESLTRMLGAAGTLLLIGLFVVAAAPARAEGVGDRITALEEELTQLKGEQAQVRSDALAATAKLPKFAYRPGAGLTITGADKSWSYRVRYLFHVHMYNEPDGNDRLDRANGDLFWRRNRLDNNFTWDNGFYNFRFGEDWDTQQADPPATQNTALQIFLGKLNPWLPTLYIHDAGGESSASVMRSSTRSASTEIGDFRILSDSANNILSHRGIALGWMNKKLGSGDANLYVEYIPCVGCSRDGIATTDHKQFFLKTRARPFRATKNKFLKGLVIGLAWKTDSIDNADGQNNNRLRIRSFNRRNNAIVYFDTGAAIGEGQHHYLHWGAEWSIGPYLTRITAQKSMWESRDDNNIGGLGGVGGHSFMIGHELFIYSPKGFMTGSSRSPGSVQVGYRFGRSDAHCGKTVDCVPGTSTASSNHLVTNDWSAWYYVRPMLRVGLWFTHFDTPNMPTNQQVEIGCSGNNATRADKSCSLFAWNLGFNANW